MRTHLNGRARWRKILLAGGMLLVLATCEAWAGNQYPLNPNLFGESVYVAQKGVTRFQLEGLKPVWAALQDRLTDEPVVTKQAILVGSRSGISALDPKVGDLRWEISSPMRLFSPSVAAGVAYIGGEDGSLRAVTVTTGKQLWRQDFSGWIYPPAIVGDYLVAGGQEQTLRGLDAANGRVLWEIPLPQELVYRPVAIANQGVVVTTFSGDILALSAQDGRLRWRIRDEVANFSPVLADDRLYFRTFGGHLRVRNQSDGSLLWETPQGFSNHPIRVTDGWVTVIDGQDRASVLKADTGEMVWQHTTQGEPIGSPALIDDRMILFTDGSGGRNGHQPTVHQWVITQEIENEKTY